LSDRTHEEINKFFNGGEFSFRSSCESAQQEDECVANALDEICSAEVKQRLMGTEGKINVVVRQFVCDQHFNEIEPIVNCALAKYRAHRTEVENRVRECNDAHYSYTKCSMRGVYYCVADAGAEMCGPLAATLGHELADLIHEAHGCQDGEEDERRRGLAKLLKRFLNSFN
jgi:hypothetical protein